MLLSVPHDDCPRWVAIANGAAVRESKPRGCLLLPRLAACAADLRFGYHLHTAVQTI